MSTSQAETTAKLSYELIVAADQMSATLRLGPPPEGFSDRDLADLLHEREGLLEPDLELLARMIERALRSNDVEVSCIATGTPPQRGADGRIEWLDEFFESHAVLRPDGSMNHYVHNCTSCREKQELLRIHPPEPGTPGRDVFGNGVPAEAGDAVEIACGEGTRFAEGCSDLVVAERGGGVLFDGKTVRICDLKEVEEVDFESGSIEFHGSVLVKRGVKDNFSVAADGEVTINGPVERCRLEAGALLRVGSAIMGHGKARLIAHADAQVLSARETQLDIEKNLLITRELLWCEGEIRGNLDAANARVLGGQLTIAGCAEIGELGSPSEQKTFLSIGRLREEQIELEDNERKRQRAREQVREVEALIAKSGGDNEVNRRHLQQLVQKYTELRVRRVQLRWVRRLRQLSGILWVHRTIHPGVDLDFGSGMARLEVTEAMKGPLQLRYDARRRAVEISHWDRNSTANGGR